MTSSDAPRLEHACGVGFRARLVRLSPGPERWRVDRLSPVPDDVLVLIHSGLLLFAALGILLGLQFLAAVLLGVAAMSQIILALTLAMPPLTLSCATLAFWA